MNGIILNWNNADHRAIYLRQLKEQPLYYDQNLKVWVVYSYEFCKALLLDENAYVPEPVIDDNGPMNDKMKLLLRKLARISNNEQHLASREAAMTIFQRINAVSVDQVLEQLLNGADAERGFDWVEVVGKRLPILLILRGLGFNDEDCSYITANLPKLVRVMLPNKTVEDIEAIDPVVNGIYEITERYIISSGLSAEQPEKTELIICNLLGLFIQCYDAGRGLLCNALLSLARQRDKRQTNKNDIAFYKDLVTETLRLDPPVHNTRRVAVRDICLGGEIIRAGETIQIVLAAANLDPDVFKDPDKFDLTRSNNEQHLTFGLGGHNCIARYLSTGMTANTCRFLENKYQNINILQKELSYEPQLNVRLVKQLMVNLS